MGSIWSVHPEQVDWMLKYYKTLEGATILDVTFEQDEFDEYILWPTLTVEFADGTVRKVYVQADPEGKGGTPLVGDDRNEDHDGRDQGLLQPEGGACNDGVKPEHQGEDEGIDGVATRALGQFLFPPDERGELDRQVAKRRAKLEVVQGLHHGLG